MTPDEQWSPDPIGECRFCHKTVPVGYALKGPDGDWQQACWPCAKKDLKPVSAETKRLIKEIA